MALDLFVVQDRRAIDFRKVRLNPFRSKASLEDTLRQIFGIPDNSDDLHCLF